MEFIKYQHYEGGSDHKAVSAHSKNSNKLDKFPLKSFMHYLTDELLRPVSIIAFNDNSSKDSCSNSLWESWSYKLYILQLLAAVMSQYGQITTAMLFELGSKSILEMETSTSTDPLSSSVSTMDSQGNVMNAVDEDEMDVDTDDRLHESTMSNAGDKLTRKYSRTSTTSSSTSKVADDAVVRTTSLVSTKGNGVALKRKHSTEDDPPIADWKSFNLLHFAEEADGNRSSSRISSWDRNNILRICKFWCVCWRSLDELPVGDALSDIDMCLLQCSILTTTIVNEIVGKFRSAQKQIVAHLLRGEPWSLINAFMYRYVSNGLHPVLKAAIGKDHIQHFDWLQG